MTESAATRAYRQLCRIVDHGQFLESFLAFIQFENVNAIEFGDLSIVADAGVMAVQRNRCALRECLEHMTYPNDGPLIVMKQGRNICADRHLPKDGRHDRRIGGIEQRKNVGQARRIDGGKIAPAQVHGLHGNSLSAQVLITCAGSEFNSFVIEYRDRAGEYSDYADSIDPMYMGICILHRDYQCISEVLP